MVDIKYGRSNGPRTSQGRRKLRRKHLQEEFKASAASIGPPKPNKLQSHIAKKPVIPPSILMATPLSDIANTAAISITEYRLCLERATVLYENEFNRTEKERPYEDAMHRVVNHAHQRRPDKKW